MPADFIGFGYAMTVAAGGVIGYVKSASLPSLAAGLAFGSIAAVGAYQTTQNPADVKVSLANSGTLMCMMGYRFFNSGKFMPAGLIAALSLLMVMKSGYKMMSQ
ncbi:transmembrane protein 14C-like [Mya arenaria]|uniref:transmembrane protein 14C-like n=1 Tax=Mya arenaria TaxID=6604 RepID=UPI0022E31110|nr:transmembrane protein 14C-like [Mya arenaria]